MNKYTLGQLAHFNRCLFPGDFAEDMQKIGGLSADEALMLQMDMASKARSGKSLNVIDLYQDNINNDAFHDALERVLQNFFQKKQ